MQASQSAPPGGRKDTPVDAGTGIGTGVRARAESEAGARARPVDAGGRKDTPVDAGAGIGTGSSTGAGGWAGSEAGAQARPLFRHEVLAVVFQVRTGGERGQRLEVLLWQRARPPFDGCWSLPGGPLCVDERLGTSLGRYLAVKVALTDIGHLEQLETRSDPGRDPRGRVLATAYLALVATGVQPSVPADTAWHPVDSLPPVAFDHGSIIESGRDRLRAKLSYTNLGFALAPDTFTIAGLRDIYAAVLGYPVAATNLQRILARREVIEPTGETAPPTTSGGRPATVYRFATRSLRVTNAFAAFRPPGGRPRAEH